MLNPIDGIKGAFVQAVLKRFVDGDAGSTLLGVAAAGLLSAHLDWGLVLQGFHSQASAMESGKAVGIVALGVWGYFIGRKKPGAKNDPPPPTAALAN